MFCVHVCLLYVWFVCVLFVPSVLWYCWLGLLICKNRLPYNLYCVGGDWNTAQSINQPHPTTQINLPDFISHYKLVITVVIHHTFRLSVSTQDQRNPQIIKLSSPTLNCFSIYGVQQFIGFCRTMHAMHSADYAVERCLFGRLSVRYMLVLFSRLDTIRYCIQTTECIIDILTLPAYGASIIFKTDISDAVTSTVEVNTSRIWEIRNFRPLIGCVGNDAR